MRYSLAATFGICVLVAAGATAENAEPASRCKTFRAVCGIEGCGVECGGHRRDIPCDADVFSAKGFVFDIYDSCEAPVLGADPRRRRFDLAISSTRRAQPELATIMAEVAVATPGFLVGGARFDPSFRLGLGRADMDLSDESHSRAQALYRSQGYALSLGGELLLTPCQGCRWYAAGDYDFRTLGCSRPYENAELELRSEVSQLRAYGAGVRIGYGFFDNHVALTAGTRFSYLQAEVNAVGGGEMPPPLTVDRRQQQFFAGADFRLTPRLFGRLELTGTGRDRQPFLSLSYRFDEPLVTQSGTAVCAADADCPLGHVCETTITGDCTSPQRVCVPGCRFGQRPCAVGLSCTDVVCKTCPCPDLCETAQPCGYGHPPCLAPHFCNYPVIAECGRTDRPGACMDRPIASQCPSGSAPVCGCDGQTYRNGCLASTAGVSVASNGPCTDPCEKATNDLVNGGFEAKSLGGWNVTHGVVDGLNHEIVWNRISPSQPLPTVITAASPLMSRQGTAVTPYCGTGMARINDLIGDYHVTRLWQTFKLPAISPCSLLRLHWGAMLHDGGHQPDEQPYFEIEALEEGNVFYSYRADATNAAASGWQDVREPGLKEPVWYRHALAAIPLTQAHPGKQVEIRLTAADCAGGEHGAAAFIDCIEILDRCANPCAFAGKQPFGELGVANVFSPNGDGVNDIWAVGKAWPACRASAQIYDRWGSLVASRSWRDPSAATSGLVPLWDGIRDDGAAALSSANPYYFVLELASCSETKEIPGFLYLFR